MPVEPVERYLAYLTDVERSPNTVKAYAHDLKDWFVFLAGRGLDWREVRLEDVGRVRGLAAAAAAGAGTGGWRCCRRWQAHCGAATVNRKLSAVSAFYQHAARHGVDLGELLTSWQPAGRRGTAWRPFLHHISKCQPAARRVIGLKVPRKHPRVLTAAEVQAILDACDRLRDRLLFAVLHDTGMRIGEALGLRHEDWAAAERQVTVVRAGQRQRRPRQVGAAADDPGQRRSWSGSMPTTCTASTATWTATTCSSTCGAEPHGHPLTYAAVYDLVGRLRRRTGIDFDPHWCRHTYATGLLRDGHPGGGGEQAARARLGDHHGRGLRAPDRRGRPRGAGAGGLVHRHGSAVRL